MRGANEGTRETPTVQATHARSLGQALKMSDGSQGLTGCRGGPLSRPFEYNLTKEMALPSALFALDAPVTVRHGPTIAQTRSLIRGFWTSEWPTAAVPLPSLLILPAYLVQASHSIWIHGMQSSIQAGEGNVSLSLHKTVFGPLRRFQPYVCMCM